MRFRKAVLWASSLVILLCLALLGWLRYQDTVGYVNPLAVDAAAVRKVTLYENEAMVELEGPDVAAFCTLWNESWICRAEVLDGTEAGYLDPPVGGGVYTIEIAYRDNTVLTYVLFRGKMGEETEEGFGKWYFLTDAYLTRGIRQWLYPDEEAAT